MVTRSTRQRPWAGPNRKGRRIATAVGAAMTMMFVLLIPAPVAAGGSAIIYNARDGFQLSPNQTNPSGPWSYRRSAPNGSRPLLENFSENAEPCGPSGDGINSWFGPEVLDLPAISRNATGSDASPCGASFPEAALMAHPGGKHQLVLRWTSPMAGNIRLRAAVIDRDAFCGDGVHWAIQLGHQPAIAKGNIENGGWMKGLRTGSYPVDEGSQLELRLGPRGTNSCDSTQVRLSIALTPDN
jgi:hypothetical protein